MNKTEIKPTDKIKITPKGITINGIGFQKNPASYYPCNIFTYDMFEMIGDKKMSNIKEDKMSRLEELENAYKKLGEEIEKLKKEEKANRVWKPKEGEEYWYIDECGDANISYGYDDDSYDKDKYIIGNCFKTQEEAEKVAEKIRIYTKLKRYAKANNEEFDKYKFIIRVVDGQAKIWRRYVNYTELGEIAFSSMEIAKQAIEEIGEKIYKLYE